MALFKVASDTFITSIFPLLKCLELSQYVGSSHTACERERDDRLLCVLPELFFNTVTLVDPLTSLQAVDILRVHSEELALVMKQTYEIVCEVGLVVAWVQLFGQGKERVGVVMEVVDLEDGFCVRKIILLEVVIETTARGPVQGK